MTLTVLLWASIVLSETTNIIERRMKTEIEYVAYHKVKRIFLPIMDIESENPENIEVYEFEGQNFKLVAK
ncbi:MAG: hypothetical protein ABJB85_07370 [Nitrososphaerota archaeon]